MKDRLILFLMYVMPGEQFHVIIHISVHHPEVPGTITPFKVAAAMEKGSTDHAAQSSQGSLSDNMNIKTPKSAKSSLKGKWFNTTPGGNLLAISEWLDEQQLEGDDDGAPSESQMKRTAMLLESFRNSHFHVKIGKKAADASNSQDSEDEDGDIPAIPHGCRPVFTEDGKFEPLSAGGLARGSTSCWSLQNGDVVVSHDAISLISVFNDDVVFFRTVWKVLCFETWKTSTMNHNVWTGSWSLIIVHEGLLRTKFGDLKRLDHEP